MKKPFFAGLEGIAARLVSFIITLVFFIIYVSTSGGVEFDWYQMAGTLTLFWLCYEGVGYLLFLFFNFFARNNLTKVDENNGVDFKEVKDEDNEDVLTIDGKSK